MFKINKLRIEFIIGLSILVIGTIGNATYCTSSNGTEIEECKLIENFGNDNLVQEEKILKEVDEETNQTFSCISDLSSKEIQSFITLSDLESETVELRDILRNPFFYQYHPNSLLKVRKDEKIEFILKYDNQFDLKANFEYFCNYNIDISEINQKSKFLLLQIPKNHLDSYQKSFLIEISELSGVKFIEPNFYYEKALIPNDSEYSYQWAPQLIGMEETWDIQMGSSSVIVAILDTGIDYTHPDLSGQYLPLGYDFINDDSDPMDDDGHGTLIAGIIAATINNGIGIAGIADVSIMAEKILDSPGYGTAENLASGIDHAVAQGVHIISISAGGFSYSQLVNDSVQNAINAGVLVISAAGDYGVSDLYYPAALSGVFAVGATDSSDNIVYYSNYGDWIDISAPGDSIYTTWLSNNYLGFSGTSAASPHVAGLAALLLSEFPSYTSDQIYNLIETTAVDLGDPSYDIYYGWGRINAYAAIFGLQDHNLQTKVSCPNVIPYDAETMIEIQVSNIGLNQENNINVSLIINDIEVSDFTITSLAPRQISNIGFNFTPGAIGSYNITGYVEPVQGEVIIIDNSYQKAVEAVAKIIDPQIDDILAYGNPNVFNPFHNCKWEIVDVLSPIEVVITYSEFNPDTLTEHIFDTYTLNPYTREISAYWDVFPYMLNPDELFIGALVDLFYIGGQEGEVVAETSYNYYGENVAVWTIDDGSAYTYYTKETGVLIARKDIDNNFILKSAFNSMLSSLDEIHNIKQIVDLFERNKTSFNIPIMVQNTGHFNESVVVEVYIDGDFVTSRSLNLNSGEYIFWEELWEPTIHDIYDIEINTTVVVGETYLVDNYYLEDYSTYPPVQYGMYSVPFDWSDSGVYGYALGLTGDDVYTSFDLEFDFFFYDQYFSTIYIDSNGFLSFVEPYWFYDWWNDPLPTDAFNYVIAPFWDDLKATNNIYYISTPSYFIVTFYFYYYSSGYEAGEFEVVLYDFGDIEFRYRSVESDYLGATVGLNLGLDLSYYTAYTASLAYKSNFAIGFTSYPDTGFIEVNVLDSSALNPIANAQVDVYLDTVTLIYSGLTDVNGFYKAVALPVGYYLVEITADGYIPEIQYEFVEEYEGNYLYFHLDLLPIRNVQILSPTNGQTVEGGIVFIEFITSDISDVVLVDMFVNDVWTANVTNLYSEYISVPVFENGTNAIRLEFLWFDTSNTFAEISIESINVTPLIEIEDGDYLYILIEFPDGDLFMEQNSTFVWHSEFELNVTNNMRAYNSTTTISQLQYEFRVNILNGYITKTNLTGFATSHYVHFNRITPETTIGDPFISSEWSDIAFISSTTTYRGNDVWVLNLRGGVLLYIEKEFGLYIYQEIPDSGYGSGYLYAETNIIDLKYAPELSTVPDYEYTYGTTGHTLTWYAYDEETSHYEIYKNDELVETDAWYSDIPIVINIDGLDVGSYNYTIVVVDEEGYFTKDTVIVTVTPVIPELKIIHLIEIVAFSFAIIFVLRFKKDKIIT